LGGCVTGGQKHWHWMQCTQRPTKTFKQPMLLGGFFVSSEGTFEYAMQESN
jgi:hypothetical protein